MKTPEINILKVLLYDKPIGTLAHLPGNTNAFTWNKITLKTVLDRLSAYLLKPILQLSSVYSRSTSMAPKKTAFKAF